MRKRETPDEQAARAPREGAARVRLTRAGVRACGPYQRETVYEVYGPEAERLVRVKGFEYVARGDPLPGPPPQAGEGVKNMNVEG